LLEAVCFESGTIVSREDRDRQHAVGEPDQHHRNDTGRE